MVSFDVQFSEGYKTMSTERITPDTIGPDVYVAATMKSGQVIAIHFRNGNVFNIHIFRNEAMEHAYYEAKRVQPDCVKRIPFAIEWSWEDFFGFYRDSLTQS